MDISVTGPKIYFEIPIFGGIRITQTTVSLFAVTLLLILAAYFLTRSISKRPGRAQVIVEKLITMLYNLVEDTMGKHNLVFAPYIGTLFLSSVIGTLIGMTQIFRSTTADLSVTLAWAIVTSLMVWYNTIKNFGFKAWLKGFTEPIVVMTPMNIVSEIAQPVSMAFRHFGNVAGGSVLTSLIYGALAALTSLLFSWLPQAAAALVPPFLQVGIPAFLSIYFDLFSGFVQALVFSLLTMVYISGACPPPAEKPQKGENK
jgi:F-type H+-transporting ATPase subunit a